MDACRALHHMLMRACLPQWMHVCVCAQGHMLSVVEARFNCLPFAASRTQPPLCHATHTMQQWQPPRVAQLRLLHFYNLEPPAFISNFALCQWRGIWDYWRNLLPLHFQDKSLWHSLPTITFAVKTSLWRPPLMPVSTACSRNYLWYSYCDVLKNMKITQETTA